MATTPGYETKSRPLNQSGFNNGVYTVSTAVPGQPVVSGITRHLFKVVGRQTTTSKNNIDFVLARKMIARLRKDKTFRESQPSYMLANLEHGDFGSNFETVRHSFAVRPRMFSHRVVSGYTTHKYRGSFSPVNKGVIQDTDPLWPKITPPTADYLFGLGGTAISRCIPTAPAADLSTALGELLREGLPNLVGANLKTALRVNRKGDKIDLRHPGNNRVRIKRTGKAKATGGEYLNYQFGILPILSDLRKLNQAVIDYDNIVSQFLRDADRMVRRRYVFPETTDEYVVSVKAAQGLWPTLPTQMYTTSDPVSFTGTLTLRRKIKIETWFSGAFTYHVDLGDEAVAAISRQAAIVRRVYGLRMTPDVAWNLAPWSWLADWFTNTGDVLKNASLLASDGLVMRYGYLMYRETVEDTYTHTGVSFKDKPTGEVSCTFRTVYQRRVKAHPYGFGWTDADLSPRQLAILAALGMTKGGA